MANDNSDKVDLDKKIERYAFVHDHAKYCFETELNRFKNLEDKASKQVSLLALVIAGFTALVAAIFKEPVELSGWPYFFVVTFVLFTFVALGYTWYFYYQALGLSESERIDFDEAYIKIVSGRSLADSHVAMSKAYALCIKSVRAVNDEKVKFMAKAHAEMYTAILFLAILILLVAVFKFVRI